MWFKHRAWIPVAWSLAIVNVAAVWFAAADAEPWHATLHGLVGAGLALGARHLASRQRLGVSQDLQQALDENEALQEALAATQAQVEQLEERIDFAERLLAGDRAAEHRGTHSG